MGGSHPELVWAALDCPTSAPIANFGDGPPMVLASLTARLGCRVRVGEPHTILSWRLEVDGRKRRAAAALYDSDGIFTCASRALWIELRNNRSRLRRMATHYRTCPFCEATCGLEIEIEGRDVVSVRGDADDVFSRGFICPKAYGVKQLHEDPDRLTTPLVRRDGELVEASWDEAFEEIDRRLTPLIAEHGKNAVAVYLGNPNAHNLSALIHGPAWLRVLGSQNVYSRLHGRPDAEADVRGADVRHDALGTDPGRGPLRPPRAARREPARLERQPAHGARHARPPARHPRARRQGRGGRPAPHANRRGGGRAPLHPPGHGRPAARGDGVHDRRGGPRGELARSPST